MKCFHEIYSWIISQPYLDQLVVDLVRKLWINYVETIHYMWTSLIGFCIHFVFYISGGDLAPSLGGTEKFFADQNFWMTFFSDKNLHFHAKKILMTFCFSHRPDFSDFYYLFSDFSDLYCVKCRIWHFLHKIKHYFKKEFLDDTYFYSVRAFVPIRQHYFSKYWGDQCMGRPHTSNFGGDRPPSPPRSPPWRQRNWTRHIMRGDSLQKEIIKGRMEGKRGGEGKTKAKITGLDDERGRQQT